MIQPKNKGPFIFVNDQHEMMCGFVHLFETILSMGFMDLSMRVTFRPEIWVRELIFKGEKMISRTKSASSPKKIYFNMFCSKAHN